MSHKRTRTLAWTPERNSVASTFADDPVRAILVTLDNADDPARQHFLHLSADNARYLGSRLLHCANVIEKRRIDAEAAYAAYVESSSDEPGWADRTLTP